MFIFSPLCVIKCNLRLRACEDAKSHWLHLFDFSPLCVFKCLLKLRERMKSRIGCIGLAFVRCAFSNDPSKRLHKKMQSHTGCICLAFLHCVFSNVSSNCLHYGMHNHIGCICLASPQFLYHCRIFSSYSLQYFPPSPASFKELSRSDRLSLVEPSAFSWPLI